MSAVIDVIASFLAGIITMPFINEGITYFGKWWIRKSYLAQMKEVNQEHISTMRNLWNRWDKIVQDFNKKLSKMEKRLKDYGLFLESDDENNQIIVKKIPVKMTFVEWMKKWRK